MNPHEQLGFKVFLKPAQNLRHHQRFSLSPSVGGSKKQFAVVTDCLNPDNIIHIDQHGTITGWHLDNTFSA